MKNTSLSTLLALIFLTSFSFASPSEDATLYQKALKENSYPPAAISTGSKKDLISLKDTFDKSPARSWLWLFSLTAESFAAQGTTLNLFNELQSFSEAEKTTMPRITLGSRWNFEEIYFQLGLNAAFARQTMKLETAKGQGLAADITTTSLSLRPAIGYRWQRLEMAAFLDRGESLTTVTSNSLLPRQNNSKQFLGYGLLAGYSFNKSWIGHGSYLQNTINANSAEIGATVLW
jgi:hypothetical protein